MNLYESIGYGWIVFTSAIATFGFFYFAWKGFSIAWRQRERGSVEENLDLRRQSEINYLEKRTGVVGDRIA